MPSLKANEFHFTESILTGYTELNGVVLICQLIQ